MRAVIMVAALIVFVNYLCLAAKAGSDNDFKQRYDSILKISDLYEKRAQTARQIEDFAKPLRYTALYYYTEDSYSSREVRTVDLEVIEAIKKSLQRQAVKLDALIEAATKEAKQ